MEFENPMKSGTIFFLMVFSQIACAASYVMMRDQDLSEQAQGVLKARVIDAKSANGETAYTLDNVKHLRPYSLTSMSNQTETLVLPGGYTSTPGPLVERAFVSVPGMSELAPYEEVLVFYHRRKDGAILPTQLQLGLFRRVELDANRNAYVRDISPSDPVLIDGLDLSAPREADLFEAFAAQSQTTSAYLKPEWRFEAINQTRIRPRFTQIIFTENNSPFRWFEFGAGTTVTWFLVPSNAASPTGTVAQTQSALASWTNDAGSTILYSYSGTTPSDPGNNSANGVNAVIQDDPEGDIAGSFNCASGGTLAVGGSFAFLTSTLFGGRPYNTSAEGFVITQDGAACFFNNFNGNAGRQVMAHELGHTLGFGHSCGDALSPACSSSTVLNDALMRAIAHSDSRDGSLRQDDQIGAAAVYPGTGGGVNLIFANGFE
jgi:hypothetical protein